MAWVKKGLIYNPTGQNEWDKHGFLTPTPFLLNDDVIRIYGGMRDDEGASRIGYIDVSAHDPSEIITISKQPCLDVGQAGMFDDNGVILGDVVRDGDQIRMYYVGFQIPKKVKFMAFSGVAISNDNGKNFERFSQTPIMDRAKNALFIRAIHSVIKEDDIWKVWYSVGNGWEHIDGNDYPQYDIRYTQSDNGLSFSDSCGTHCIGVNENEYRIGRPRVYKTSDGYMMNYTSDTRGKEYKAGQAYSKDGMNWTRKDEDLKIEKSEAGWDSEMLCYPVMLETPLHKYMFYSGNNMGMTGVGYARWES